MPGTINGALTVDDCVLEPGFPTDPVYMEVLSTTTLRIDLASTAFDAFLMVADSTDTIVLSDDDGAGLGSTNSRIQATFPKGRYTLLAQAYYSNSAGAYTLSVSLAAGIQQGLRDGTVRFSTKPPRNAMTFTTKTRREP